MKKSYNDIKAQEQRVMALCMERGRYCDNTKSRFDTQHLAQITRKTLTQHGFPIFGQFDKDDKRDCINYETERKHEKVNVQERKTATKVCNTPTEKAHERIAFDDWMNADISNRKQLQNMCRHNFINKMYAELLTDMEICKLEHWDMMEFPRMIKEAISVCFPKQPKQLTLFDI